MKKKHRLIFFGSPEFALPPLKTLYLGGYEIVGVYTQEPKKKSRGMKELKTPVHLWAESQLLPVYFPCLLYTSPSPRDVEESRMPSSA